VSVFGVKRKQLVFLTPKPVEIQPMTGLVPQVLWVELMWALSEVVDIHSNTHTQFEIIRKYNT